MIGYVIILILVVAFFYAIYSKTVEKEKTEKKTKAKHGEIKGYHSNGKLHYISNWNNGIQHGPIKSYDEKGNLIKKSNLVNGEYQGEQIEYYPSGAIKIKRIYKNDEIVEEQEYDLLGNLKEKLDEENPTHITQMYLLRDKLNASKDEAEFNSIKQELINLIKDHSPKDSSGKHVSIAFIKEGGDMLDGIILSDIEALEFKKKTSKEPSFNLSLTKESFYKIKESINSEFIENHQNDLDTVSIWIDSYKVNSEIPLAELIFLKVQLSLVLQKNMMIIIGDLNELMLNHVAFKPNEGELGASLYETLSEGNDTKTKKETGKFVKSSAIDFVNNRNGFSKLNNSNTSFSNINKTNPVFWINVDPKKFSKEFNIICIDKNELIWFSIPQGEFNEPDKQFYIRKDNGKVHIEIPIKGENDYLNDIKNGVKLNKYAKTYDIE